MATMPTIKVDVLQLEEMKAIIAASVDVVNARNAGADCYEAKDEIDRLEAALVNVKAGGLEDYRHLS